MREARRPFVIVLWLVAVTMAIEVAVLGHDRDEPLVITDFTREETREVDRNFVEDVYRATLTHTGREDTRDFAGVTASIAQPFNLPIPGIVPVIDGDLTFGPVRASDMVESSDTVTIRRRRSQLLEPWHLRWSIDGRPDVVLPDVWAGTWRYTLTYMDGETNEVSQVSEITGAIPPGPPLGLSLIPRLREDVEPEPLALGFMTSFVMLPGFSSLIADGIRNATRDEPDSERRARVMLAPVHAPVFRERARLSRSVSNAPCRSQNPPIRRIDDEFT